MYNSYDSAMAFVGGFFLIMFIICSMIAILQIIITWKVFTKMGLDGWKSLIPFYNTYVLCEKVFGNGLYMLCLFAAAIPVVGEILLLLFIIIMNIRLAKSFGKDTAFVVGLIFLPTIFMGILAFGNAQYQQLPDYDYHNPFE